MRDFASGLLVRNGFMVQGTYRTIVVIRGPQNGVMIQELRVKGILIGWRRPNVVRIQVEAIDQIVLHRAVHMLQHVGQLVIFVGVRLHSGRGVWTHESTNQYTASMTNVWSKHAPDTGR